MIKPEAFVESLSARGVGLFAGVPDSLLSSLCAFLADNEDGLKHVIAANEGNAIAMAAGFHLATGRLAAVYMQNSGLGNAVNPLTSLTDSEVYRIPLLLIIGWRGEPNVKDEPQHVKQGKITQALLDVLGIPHWILDDETDLDRALESAFSTIAQTNAPVALVVRKNAFGQYKAKKKVAGIQSSMLREEALSKILDLIAPEDLLVSTTGKTSRELFELRKARNEEQRDFLTVGSMGHTSSIALGVALGNTARRVLCLDGDGSMLMHLGAAAIIGDLKPKNLVHILLNNGAHESVGGQPTVAGRVDFRSFAASVGYSGYAMAMDKASLEDAWKAVDRGEGPILVEVLLAQGSREELGRPTTTPEQNKKSFMDAAIG